MARYFNASLKNLQARLRKFKSILSEELEKTILENEEVIIQMITEQQLYEQGIEGRGIEIASYRPYAWSTIKRKHKKGQPVDRVTLRDTGKFYKSLHVEFDPTGGFYIVSTDYKAKYLLKRYGTTIFRLTDSNLKILLDDYIRPSLLVKLKESLQHD